MTSYFSHRISGYLKYMYTDCDPKFKLFHLSFVLDGSRLTENLTQFYPWFLYC